MTCVYACVFRGGGRGAFPWYLILKGHAVYFIPDKTGMWKARRHVDMETEVTDAVILFDVFRTCATN